MSHLRTLWPHIFAKCSRFLRLAPERVREEGGKVHVGFDIIDPWVMDSGWLAGTGDFVLENGELREP